MKFKKLKSVFMTAICFATIAGSSQAFAAEKVQFAPAILPYDTFTDSIYIK